MSERSGRPRQIAVVGAGPAGIYTADALAAASAAAPAGSAAAGLAVDLLERLPAPFGLVRYGVAPDHPKIRGITSALHALLARGGVRLVGNVAVGRDVAVDELRRRYDAVVVTTGASRGAPLPVPGVDLAGSHDAADLVAWYNGHPDAPRSWALDTPAVAVVGAGNVALDVARVLARPPADLLATDVPGAVAAALAASAVRDVHVLGRRGPAQARFTPVELRQLAAVPGLGLVVDPADLDLDGVSAAAAADDRRTGQVVAALARSAADRATALAQPRRVHLRFWSRPVRVLGRGRVAGVEVERTAPTADGGLAGTGEVSVLPVQAVYRAVGFRSEPVPGLPFDERAGVVPARDGRVVGADGRVVPGLYVAGWLGRGPVGVIGHAHADARSTAASLLADLAALPPTALAPAAEDEPDALLALLRARGARPVLWSDWERLDAFERALGAGSGRGRVKVVDAEEMLRVALALTAPDGGPERPTGTAT